MDLSKLTPIQTPEFIKRESEKSVAIQYLKSTDWYVIRKLETDKEIPEDILELRDKARTVVSD